VGDLIRGRICEIRQDFNESFPDPAVAAISTLLDETSIAQACRPCGESPKRTTAHRQPAGIDGHECAPCDHPSNKQNSRNSR
jgi:hypothetical protein